MLKILPFTILVLIFFIREGHAYTNQMALKGGFSLSQNWIEARNETEDRFEGFGLNSHYGYRWTNLEINLSSHVHFGKVNEVRFEANNTCISGSGGVRTFSFGPTIKYLFQYQPINKWFLFISGGPTWSLKTFTLNNYTTEGGDFRKDDRLTYTTKGLVASFGLEERLTYKEEHPAYLEVSFGYNQARKVSVVDASNFKRVETLSTEPAIKHVKDYLIIVNLGITIF